MISVNNIKRACLAALNNQLNPDSDKDAALALELVNTFQAPNFFVENNQLGFFTGVDKETGTPCFLLELSSVRKLLVKLQQHLGCNLSDALDLIGAGLTHAAAKYDMVQQVNLANESQYKGVTNSFGKLARQSKSQAMFEEVRTQLTTATELSIPTSPTALQALLNGGRARQQGRRPRVRMLVSLDFEWWEKSSQTILEVGWSLWDTVTQRHRTRHWIIRENLNKHNGGYISDNRMNFLFGTSERGSLDRAFDALQAELDALGVSDGLTRQQKDLLESCDIDVVLVGHAMTQDQEHAELFEIEWPEGMVTFDTQKLFVGYQLEQMDTAAAAAALRDMLARRKTQPTNGPKPLTLELVDQYEENQEEDSEDDGYGVPDDLDSDDSDYGLPGAMATMALAKKAKNRPDSQGSGSRIAAVQPEKRKAVQGPVRVRPWPAGPLPSEREEKTDKGDKQPNDKINRQIGLGPMLADLKIKGQKLHNAGNDARFTMEAFLAVTGHPVCNDPVAAHRSLMQHDPRYQQQLEASIAAAAEQGWGAPVPVQPPSKRGKAPGPLSHSTGRSSPGGSVSSSAGTSPSPHVSGAGAWGNRPAAAAAANGAGGAPPGAWGRPAAAAAAPAAPANSAGGAPPGAWGRPAPAAAPAAAAAPARGAWAAAAAGLKSAGVAPRPAAAQQAAAGPRPAARPANPAYLPNNPYQHNEDGW